MTVANAPSAPVLVRDVDRAPRTPYQTTAQVWYDSFNGEPSVSVPFAVPPGKLFTIEHVSLTGRGFPDILVDLEVSASVSPADVVRHVIDAEYRAHEELTGWYRGSQAITAYTVAAGTHNVVAHRFTHQLHGAYAEFVVSIGGYLTDP